MLSRSGPGFVHWISISLPLVTDKASVPVWVFCFLCYTLEKIPMSGSIPDYIKVIVYNLLLYLSSLTSIQSQLNNTQVNKNTRVNYKEHHGNFVISCKSLSQMVKSENLICLIFMLPETSCTGALNDCLEDSAVPKFSGFLAPVHEAVHLFYLSCP